VPTTVRGPKLRGMLAESPVEKLVQSSDANKKSAIVRSEQTFAEYIKDPRAKVHSTKMNFADIENEQHSKDLWGMPEAVRRQRKHKNNAAGALARRRGPRFHQQHTPD
jgi:cytochrome c2